ncbi:ricin-type beta-trefoil lectin domain protein [Streptomyces sp. NPDC005122]
MTNAEASSAPQPEVPDEKPVAFTAGKDDPARAAVPEAEQTTVLGPQIAEPPIAEPPAPTPQPDRGRVGRFPREGGRPGGSRRRGLVIGSVFGASLLVTVPFLIARYDHGGKARTEAQVKVGESARPYVESTGVPSGHPGSAKSSAFASSPGARPTGFASAGTLPVAAGFPGSTASSTATSHAKPKQTAGASTAPGAGATHTASASPTVAPPPPPAPGYGIVNFAADKCLSAGAGKDGTRLTIAVCSPSSANEYWDVRSDGSIRSMGLCMDAAWAGTSNGTAVQLARCNGGPAQQFVLKGSYDLVNVNADRCASLVGQSTSYGTPLELRDCNGQGYQKWRGV